MQSAFTKQQEKDVPNRKITWGGKSQSKSTDPKALKNCSSFSYLKKYKYKLQHNN